MESISVFDMLKIGVGPSSSHTLGPWKALKQCLKEYAKKHQISMISQIEVQLFGSLAKTGTGHGTNKAIMLGIMGYDWETIDCGKIEDYISEVKQTQTILVLGQKQIRFDPKEEIIFNTREQLPFHSNALKVTIVQEDRSVYSDMFYSIGGGFVVKGPANSHIQVTKLPCPVEHASDLLKWCRSEQMDIAAVVMKNELAWRDEETIKAKLEKIMIAMMESVYRGCHTTGMLPGGLQVLRRASSQNNKLIKSKQYDSLDGWISLIKEADHSFQQTLNWVSCFALAVNEENAAFGRVVTAPTNGAAGVIPAVMLYYLCFIEGAKNSDLYNYLLVAGELGSIFKKGATISAAMGGCQAEIGVSSAMAAGALTFLQGGSTEQVLMAAEIAMEHHLGLTCDPIGGLVQVPCIERNAMGAMKAITASQIAMASDPRYAKVTLDDVIKTMWQTAEDMNSKYKETSEGGLAISIPVSFPDC